jgi:hypothetical protein
VRDCKNQKSGPENNVCKKGKRKVRPDYRLPERSSTNENKKERGVPQKQNQRKTKSNTTTKAESKNGNAKGGSNQRTIAKARRRVKEERGMQEVQSREPTASPLPETQSKKGEQYRALRNDQGHEQARGDNHSSLKANTLLLTKRYHPASLKWNFLTSPSAHPRSSLIASVIFPTISTIHLGVFVETSGMLRAERALARDVSREG